MPSNGRTLFVDRSKNLSVLTRGLVFVAGERPWTTADRVAWHLPEEVVINFKASVDSVNGDVHFYCSTGDDLIEAVLSQHYRASCGPMPAGIDGAVAGFCYDRVKYASFLSHPLLTLENCRNMWVCRGLRPDKTVPDSMSKFLRKFIIVTENLSRAELLYRSRLLPSFDDWEKRTKTVADTLARIQTTTNSELEARPGPAPPMPRSGTSIDVSPRKLGPPAGLR